MEIKTIYTDWKNIDEKLRNKEVHVIAFAEIGKSVFRTYAELIGKISHEVIINYCNQANKMYGYITLFPLMTLSAIARKYFRREMSEPENFTCAVQNKDFIVQCINSVAKEFEHPKSEIEICEIWLNEEIFVE